MSFSNKVVVITGAAGGIGKEAVKAFVNQGAKVVLVDLSESDLEAVVHDLEVKREDYLLCAADVTNETEVEGFVQTAKKQFGKIDVFFNNAGIAGEVVPITDYSAEALDSVLNVNVKGSFYGLKHVLRVMKEQQFGSVINTASIAGLKGSPNISAYITSKHAVIGLTKAAAVEVARLGIRVNAICPSLVNTDMARVIEDGISNKGADVMKEKFTRAIPMNRYGEPSDIVNLLLFLASDHSAFITGVSYPVDGGLSAL